MTNHVNQSQKPRKQFLVPVRRRNDQKSVDLVPVPENVYNEIQRTINRVRKQKQRSGQCCCPYQSLWKCDIDCDNCEYAIYEPVLSLEAGMNGSDDETSNLLNYLASDSDPSDEVEMSAFAEVVHYLLASFSQRDREIFLLHTEGLSQRQIADEVGCSQGTVKNHLKEIIEYLQGYLADWK